MINATFREKESRAVMDSYGGEGGIRTHGALEYDKLIFNPPLASFVLGLLDF